MARYIYPSLQQDYEKRMHCLYIEDQKVQLRHLEDKVMKLIRERRDYEAWYYRPVTAKNVRISKEATEYLESIWGD